MIPSHVVRFGQALKPVLASVAEALTPKAATMRLPSGGAAGAARLRAVNAAASHFATAAERIPEAILSREVCPDVQIAGVIEPMQAAVNEFIALLDATASAAIQANATRRDDTLHRITRDHLVSIAHWLADFVEVTARPELILVNGRSEPDGKMSLLLELSMPTPDSYTELDAWFPAGLAYRAEHVRAALRLEPMVCLPIADEDPGPDQDLQQAWRAEPRSSWGAITGGQLLAWLLGG